MTDQPDGVDTATVQALGALSEALEKVERARGHLYAFHQLSGAADLGLQQAVRDLRDAGHHHLAERLHTVLVGRNVLPGRWTYQVVEEYDDGYWSVFRELEAEVRGVLAGGRRHLLEARMKRAETTPGAVGHELTPDAVSADPVPPDEGERAVSPR